MSWEVRRVPGTGEVSLVSVPRVEVWTLLRRHFGGSSRHGGTNAATVRPAVGGWTPC